MNSDEFIRILKESEPQLRARGVTHAALFGSRARGDHRPDSDIDIAIDPAAPVTIYDYVAIKNYISDLFERPVDVVERDSLKPHLRASATANMIDAF